MKKLLRCTATLALLVAFVFSIARVVEATKPPDNRWLYGAAGYARALELQRELKVPLIVYFYTDWCPYCHTLDNEYLPASPVQEYLRSVVKVRINPEDSPDNRELAKQYRVRGYPTFLVIDGVNTPPRSVSPFRKNGPKWTPTQFVEACRQAGSLRAAAVATTPQSTPRLKVVEVARTANVSRPAVNDAPLPPVDAVLTKYVDATGGANLQNRVSSRVVKGKIDVAGVSFGGRFEVYATSAGKSLAVIDSEPAGLVKHCFDGRAVWFYSADGAQNMNTPELGVLAAADLYRESRLANMYARLKLLRKIKEGYRDVYEVEAAKSTGTPDKLYFDVESGLLLHRDLTRQTSRGPVRSQIYYGDWRKVDGVMLPFRLTQTILDRTFVITLDEIKLNAPVEDSVFQRPSR
ncbi:MAG TPA: thioredoxin fold domain-containing protein [Pyrinomonadaceae bacterium]|nr:thioredoxin fold domain-containing protein [Pyrinomonadaceae bacterium]